MTDSDTTRDHTFTTRLVNSPDIPHVRLKKKFVPFRPSHPFSSTLLPQTKTILFSIKKIQGLQQIEGNTRNVFTSCGEGHPTCVTLVTKTCLLCGFSYFWRPSRGREYLGLTETSKPVHKCKPYPEHVEHSSQIVKEMKERDTHVKEEVKKYLENVVSL